MSKSISRLIIIRTPAVAVLLIGLWYGLLDSSSTSLEVPQLEELKLVLRDGQFEIPDHPSNQSAKVRRSFSVNPGSPFPVTVVSKDFIYTLQLSPTGEAIVILPYSEQKMSWVFSKGTYRLNIVQGCGKPFRRHLREIIFQAG